ncbi:MAG TPA: hypothetical protein VGZ69_02075 [Candidatus Rhabdochlamydia sp.]|jgi:hypothetical protein|nr:hypothetical protein [Candidatus Rhabdochlamydia sp.]
MTNHKEINESEYTWNDYVIVKKNAPKQFHPGEIGVVCGMSEIEREEIAKEFHAELGDWFYIVEFGDGSSVDVAGRFLEKYPEE